MKTLLDLFKELSTNVTVVLLIIVTLCVFVTIIGFIPFGAGVDARIVLNGWQRGGFLLFALVIPGLIAAVKYASQPSKPEAITDAEYEKRFEDNRQRDLNITPLNATRLDRDVNRVKLRVYIGDISTAQSDVLVSSDDNFFQAKGGVAKAILKQAGTNTERELSYYRTLKPKLGQGDLTVTTGGATESRFIIHAAVIDLVLNLYPDKDVVRRVVRRSLLCAAAFGARSISFPVVGGGTASKHLEACDIIRVIVSEFIVFAEKYQSSFDSAINSIALYVFNPSDIPADLEALFPPEPKANGG